MSKLVRLAVLVDDDDPAQAVQTTIELLVEHGLRSWHYRVDGFNDGVLGEMHGIFTGHSVAVSGNTETATDPRTLGDDPSDEELLAYAAQLNSQ